MTASAMWLIGAYIPALSNAWVDLNVLTPAGRPHRLTFPFAYPAVGIDGHALCSLIGLLLVIGALTRWVTYLERYTPPPLLPAPTAESPTPTALAATHQGNQTTNQGEMHNGQ